MKNLPVPVTDEDIEEMFEFGDKNKDGKLSYREFEVSIACTKIVKGYPFFFVHLQCLRTIKVLRKCQPLPPASAFAIKTKN